MSLKEVSKCVNRIYGAMALMSPSERTAINIDYSIESTVFWRPCAQYVICTLQQGIMLLLSIAASMERPESMPSW